MRAVYKKNIFTNVPPSPPAKLINYNNFFLDFSSRKFLNIGLDLTPRFTLQYCHVLKYFRRFSQTYLLTYGKHPIIYTRPTTKLQKYKINLFLDSNSITICSMVYQGENMLVIESKIQDGCRILLNCNDLLKLQDLEWSIFEKEKLKSLNRS